MRNLLSRLLVVALLLVACSGAVWGDNLTVTVTMGGTPEKQTSQTSLESALSTYTLNVIDSIEVSAGDFTEADWEWLKSKTGDLKRLRKFVVTDDIRSVADIPNSTGSPYFSGALEELHVAKLKKIGDYAFYKCLDLTSVSLPAVTEIGDYAFYKCLGLTSVSLPAATKIGAAAFHVCTNLTSVLLPAATEIGNAAFADCKGLTSVSLPAATEIGDNAFNYCPVLMEVSLPVATKIGYRAFIYCESLTSVSLPAASEIGDEAFWSCSRLTRLQLGATPPSVRSHAFDACPPVRKLELIDADGTPLTGDALTAARANYREVGDGDTEDNLWYGWAFEDAPTSNLSGTIDGVAFSGAASLEAAMQGKDFSKVKEVTITGGRFQVSDWGFLQEQGQHGLAIEKFTITSSVDRVADMLDLRSASPRYLPKAQQVNIAKVKKIGDYAFYNCSGLTSVSLPAATEIGEVAFKNCTGLTRLRLRAIPPSVWWNSFANCPNSRTLIITDAMGVPLVGTELESAAAKYDRSEGAPNDGKWSGWTIEKNPPTMLSVIVEPAGAGTAKITRKASGAEINVGDALTKDEVLIVKGEPDGTHKVKKITAAGATKTSDNEWKVTAEPGAQVVFTVKFKAKGGAAPTLGTPIITPTGAGTAKITRKASGAVVNVGDALTKDEVLIVKGEPDGTHEVKMITATGATNTSGIEWKVDIARGQVTFTVQFKAKGGAVPTLGTPIITPAGAGTAKITRKASGAVVNVGDELTKDEVLVITVKPKDARQYQLKEVTAKGADKAGKNEWKVDIASGKVTFTVVFEKKPEEEGGNNNNNDPTPVESALLAQARLSPNPTDGQVTIDAGTTVARCEVYSSTGALLQTIEAPESVFTIDLTASPSGVYLVRLVDMQGGCKTLRVVKQ